MDTKSIKTTGPKGLRKRGTPIQEGTQQGAPQQGSDNSGVPSRGTVAISELTVGASAKGRDEPEVRNLPEVRPGISIMEVSVADIAL
jgi:hypothetical protein